MKCTRESFEKAFKTKLEKFELDPQENYAFHSFFFPPPGASWTPILEELIDDVYIQWPHMYMSPKPSAQPPVVSYYHLEVPRDVASRLNATKLHENGMTGEGIRVVMIDTGFEHASHPFFSANRYTSKVVLAGDALDEKKDFFGHGTGQSANIFALAPRVEFIGVKIASNDLSDLFDINPASMLEGFYKACQRNPDIISISAGGDLRDEESHKATLESPKESESIGSRNSTRNCFRHRSGSFGWQR